MEYGVWLLCGMVVLLGLLLLRRRSRRLTNRPNLSYHPHHSADGSFMCIASTPRQSTTDYQQVWGTHSIPPTCTTQTIL